MRSQCGSASTSFSERRETLTGNPVVLVVVGILAVLQALFTYAPAMQQIFRTRPLDAASWAVLFALGVAVFVAVELEKAVLRHQRIRRL